MASKKPSTDLDAARALDESVLSTLLVTVDPALFERVKSAFEHDESVHGDTFRDVFMIRQKVLTKKRLACIPEAYTSRNFLKYCRNLIQ
jgi:hypothetical protein